MTREPSGNLRPTFVSFSGIDGAGKSTQIADLCARLDEAGLSVRILAFWDDVAAFKGFREFLSRALFHGESGVGRPAKPVSRPGKNGRYRPIAALRFLLYFMGALSLQLKMSDS